MTSLTTALFLSLKVPGVVGVAIAATKTKVSGKRNLALDRATGKSGAGLAIDLDATTAKVAMRSDRAKRKTETTKRKTTRRNLA